MRFALLVSVFVIASCGLIYELVAGTLSSYLLGDSVLQFSTVIGTYLFAMGCGSWVSKYLTRGLAGWFVRIELMVGIVGGFSSVLLFLAFSYTDSFRAVLYGLVFVVGLLVGLEVPLLMRILRQEVQFRELVAGVLTFDYLGALGASLLFPLAIVPQLGLVRGALAFGLLNVGVAIWSVYLFRSQLSRRVPILAGCGLAVVALGVGLWGAERISSLADERLYADEVVFAKNTAYQRIVLTKWRDDLRLFLNGHLQFSSRDEYRYHEGLVHPGLAATPATRVLVLGGGDGLAVREVLRYPGVKEVVLVDLDPEMTRLFRDKPQLAALNGKSLSDGRVRIVNADAFVWLEETAGREDRTFDFAVVDFPDPTSYSVSKLYTTAFYRLLGKHLSAGGRFAVQSTSPMFARQTYWCIVETIKASGFDVSPYHVYVPAFGEWGFVLAGRRPYGLPETLPKGLRFLKLESLRGLFDFPEDMSPVEAEVNRLNNQVVVRYYEREWSGVSR